jgi:cell division septal protein FtsQ
VSPSVDERAQRRARVRATAASIVDSPRVARRFAGSGGTALRGSSRRRVSRPVEAPRPRLEIPGTRRLVIIGVVLLQLALLVGALTLPAFHVTGFQVSGTALLARQAVLDAAGISTGQSIFTVDFDGARNRLEHLAWVRSATVESELPNTVNISVVEWKPELLLRSGGVDRLVLEDGAVAATNGRAPAVPLLADLRAGSNLAATLAEIARSFPKAFNCSVSAFEWQADGRLAIVTATGWRALLGHVDTQEQIAAITGQLASLAALKGHLNFAKPNFGYVDLENPAEPAVGGTPGQPPAYLTPPAAAAPAAAAPARPAPAAPAPAAAATPTPAGPKTFVLPAPTAHH